MKEIRLISQILLLVFSILSDDNDENRSYWNQVKLKEDHCLNYVLDDIKRKKQEKTIKREKILNILKDEAWISLLSYMKKDEAYRKLYNFCRRQDEKNILSDLVSQSSIVIECISEILYLNIIFHCKDRSIEFNPSESMREKPISLYFDPEKKEVKEYMTAPNYRIKSVKDDNLSKRKRKNQKHENIFKESNLSDSSSEDESESTKDFDSLKRKRKAQNIDIKEKRQPLERKLSEESISEGDLACLRDDLNLSESEDENEDQEIKDKLEDKKESKTVEIDEKINALKEFSPLGVLFKQELDISKDNLEACFIICERLRKHLLVLKANILPENIEKCARCPQHCSAAVLRCTKDRRGPKTPKPKKMKIMHN